MVTKLERYGRAMGSRSEHENVTESANVNGVAAEMVREAEEFRRAAERRAGREGMSCGAAHQCDLRFAEAGCSGVAARQPFRNGV